MLQRMIEGPVQRLLRMRPGELVPALWSALYFFCVLCSYFILRPVREALGLARGVDELSWLFMGTLLVTLSANPLLHALMGRYPRQVFIPVTYRFFSLNLLVFCLLLLLAPSWIGANVGRVFYIWLSVFNLVAVTLFWALLADGFSLEQSKRLFGFIGIGGTLGAIVGASLTRVLAERVPPAVLMLISIGMLEAAVACVRVLTRSFALRAAGPVAPTPLTYAPAGDAIQLSAWSGIVTLFRSSYLLSICAYVFPMSILATFMYFAQARIVESAATSTGARSRIFANLDVLTQVTTLLIQLLLTGRIMKRFGVGVTLAVLPALFGVSFLALARWPTLALLYVLQSALQAARHSLARPARETLFTVVSRDEKYKSKSFIDTFVYRSGDVTGAVTDKLVAKWAGAGQLVTPVGFALAHVAAIAVPIAAVWGALGLYLGRRQRRLGAEITVPAVVPDPVPDAVV